MFWQSWYPATFISSSVLPLLPQHWHHPSFMLYVPTPCQSALFARTESHRHLQCHLLPPVMYSTTPFLLGPPASACCCHRHRALPTPFHSGNAPVGSLLFPRSCRDSCAVLCRLHLSFTSALPLQRQCRVQFLGLGVFYYLRRPRKSSGP